MPTGLRKDYCTPEDGSRRRHCRAFLTKGLEKKRRRRLSATSSTAYGQAVSRWLGESCNCSSTTVRCCSRRRSRGACTGRPGLSPRNISQGPGVPAGSGSLFLGTKREHGILVMDEVDKTEDRRFVARLQACFTKTTNGRYRTTWIVPTPFFVASDMTYAVQAADV